MERRGIRTERGDLLRTVKALMPLYGI
jgi:hypothetical protein